MIWQTMAVVRADTETDRLGNDVPTGTYTTLAECSGRFSPWSDQDTEINGREVTENEQRYLLPVAFETIKTATHVRIGGVYVEITKITDNAPRWTILQIRKWRA